MRLRYLKSIIVLCLLTLFTAACDKPIESTNEAVGFRRLQLTDPLALGAIMPVVVWYPTAAKAEKIKAGPFEMEVATDAPPKPGKFPLVVISHGSGGSAFAHYDFALALARQGYVVAAPEHARDNFRDFSGVGTAEVWAGRPAEVTRVINAMVSEPNLSPAVDPDRIGAMGLSAGGYTVLALLGAQADMGELVAHCERAADDSAFCRYREQVLGARNSGRIALEPLPNAHDPRIKAAVLMAPLAALFRDEALKAINVPIRLYGAEKDEILSPRHHAERLRKLLPMDRLEYVVVENAGHFSFISPFPPELKGKVGPADQDPPGFNRAAWHEQGAKEIVDFFNRRL